MAAQAPNMSKPGEAHASSRERILKAAKELFAIRGYENTSTVAIARKAGTSESQLMKHYGSKEGLLEAIFDQGWEALAAQLKGLPALPSPEQKLRAMLEAMLAALERDPELKQLMLLEGRRIRKEGMAVMTTAGFLSFVQVVDNVLQEMRVAGQLRSDVDPQAVRSALMGIFEGMLRDQLLAQKIGYPCTFQTGEVRRVFDVFLPALRPAK
jgi:AcrR family transcriptional regulator